MTLIQPHFFPKEPVRKIVPGNRGVTGIVPLFGKYESTLERDLMEILRFDPDVEQFTPQPLTIDYLDREGHKHSYTPDGLIKFKASTSPFHLPILFEVKYREDFRKDWKALLPKFRAAKSYCMTQTWRFEVFTEREIRTPYLKNVKFLWQYLERIPEPAMMARALEVLNDLDQADPDLLLCALCNDTTNRARFIPVIWHLIAIGAIGCDLNQPLTMRSLIQTRGGCCNE